MRCPKCNERFDEDIINERWEANDRPKYFSMLCPYCKDKIKITVLWIPKQNCLEKENTMYIFAKSIDQ
jgi:NAD-dependent SIR2 family protein deacetylase